MVDIDLISSVRLRSAKNRCRSFPLRRLLIPGLNEKHLRSSLNIFKVWLQPPDDASYAVVGEGGDRLVVLPVRVLPRDSLGELFRHHLSEMQLDIYMIPPPWQ